MNRSDIVRRLSVSALITVKAMMSPVALGVCAIVEDKDGRVLLVRHRYQGGWMLPGGGVGRGEPPATGIRRELQEEVGLGKSGEPEFIALYTRRAGWVTNVIALYHLRDAEILFRPNLEVCEVLWAETSRLPAGITGSTARRIAEYFDGATRGQYW